MFSIDAVAKVIRRFDERAVRDAQKPAKLGWLVTPKAFGNVARRRRRRITQLISKPEITAHCAGIRQRIDAKLQLIGESPRVEFVEGTGAHAAMDLHHVCRTGEPENHPRTSEPREPNP